MKTILFFTSNLDSIGNISYFKNTNLEIIDISSVEITNLCKTFIDKKNSDNLFFASDNIDFLLVSYRLYNQLFAGFIYHKNENKIDIKTIGEYEIFTTSEIKDEENINVPIYTLTDIPKVKINVNFQNIQDLDEIQINIKDELIQKVFYFKNRFLITEFIDFDYKIITLDNSSNKGTLDLNDFFLDLENHLISHIKYIFELFNNLDKNINNLLEKIKIILDRLSISEQEKFIIHFKFLVNNLSDENIKSYLHSFLVTLKFFNSLMFASLIKEIKKNDKLTPQNKYFLFWQYSRLNFIKPIEKQVSGTSFWDLYRDIYSNYKKLFENIEFIPKEKRNKNLIFVFINQVLGETHAPTRLLLERAYHLIKDFGKEILIINTADLLTKNGSLAFYDGIVGNKIEQFSTMNKIPFKDIDIPFYQSAVDMPNENEMLNILTIVDEYKPYFILNIGSGNLTADLASNLVTSVSFPTTSNLAISESQIRISRDNLNTKQKELCDNLNIDKKSTIISHPSNGLKIGEHPTKGKNMQINYTKKDFNLPEDKFLLSVVGNRLSDEVTDEFITMLLDTLEYNTYIVFIGSFNTYDSYCSKYPKLKENSKLLGFQEHLYEVLKLFYLFINPSRIGGGTGCSWSIMHSIPILTLDYGDVNSRTQGKFAVKSYEEMKKTIIKHTQDSIFYTQQANLAFQLFCEFNDVKKELEKLIYEIEQNDYFK